MQVASVRPEDGGRWREMAWGPLCAGAGRRFRVGEREWNSLRPGKNDRAPGLFLTVAQTALALAPKPQTLLETCEVPDRGRGVRRLPQGGRLTPAA